MSPRVALVTFADFPGGWDDDKVLAGALRRLGAEVGFVCWDDPSVQWAALDLAVVRSTWDYYHRIDAFLAWADFVAGATRLVNGVDTIRWNSHKGYLLELEAAGVPIVPTRVVRRGEAFALPIGDWIVKPAVSGGAHRTTRGATQADLDALVADTDALVQPYRYEIESGETSLVCIAGELSHAVHKVPEPGDYRTQEHLGAAVELVDTAPRLAALARDVLALAPEVPAYARVDVVETADGPLLMELELIEPTLWFARHPPAAEALASHLLAQLG
ncbi:MAG: hypothetical protein ABIV94_06355 [Acidimicrobiales bacterium]